MRNGVVEFLRYDSIKCEKRIPRLYSIIFRYSIRLNSQDLRIRQHDFIVQIFAIEGQVTLFDWNTKRPFGTEAKKRNSCSRIAIK